MHTPDRTAYPPELERAEAALIADRRKQGESPGRLPADTLGFALSGGGIRSATFCLGLFQALSFARLLGRIDFLSTVSGGGYFGAFLGRLFTRDWIRNVDDVEHVLQATDPPDTRPGREGWGAHTFKWLRENGRYLAPRGSGDLVLFGALLFRNWVAVQVVMLTTVLTACVALQVARAYGESWLRSSGWTMVVNVLDRFPGPTGLILWSPWILLVVPLIPLVVVPGWTFWLVLRRSDGRRRGLSPAWGVVLMAAIGAAGTAHYSWSDPQPWRFALSVALLVLAVLVLVCWRFGEWLVANEGTPLETGEHLRNGLTSFFTNALMTAALVVAFAALDTAGGTIYAATRDLSSLTRWGASLLATFAGVGAFARPLFVFLTTRRGSERVGLPGSVISWIAAISVLTIWLLAVVVASHAVVRNFAPAAAYPAAPATVTGTTVSNAEQLEVHRTSDGYVVAPAPPALTDLGTLHPFPAPSSFATGTLVVLVLLTLLFGHTLTFANMSSIHQYYAARLTQTFLGASNPERLASHNVGVSDIAQSDDCSGRSYWRWPTMAGELWDSPPTPLPRPWTRGGPLHIVNTTVNETLDAKTKVQNQDRKGTGLAIGPCGLSLGVRHHLVQTVEEKTKAYPEARPDGSVFRVFREDAMPPETLSLGHWMSISGAAFSTASGVNTTVPIALLAGMFNIRLGYWWNSGLPAPTGSLWSMFERVLPVQAALLAEWLGRTRGTAGRLWNLCDGGHFENMGGYELIRRRLPVIVIVDAEADPDYVFEGLSDLVRKARLDFGAEVTFMTDQELGRDIELRDGTTVPVLPPDVRPYFGDLRALRRGRWMDEPVPTPDGSDKKRFTIEIKRSYVSCAHAALATVKYGNGDRSWLLYVKATLMGEEPEDVCHYHRSHPDFPQETTLDQFFDEAQWESYRRLGQHIGHRVLTPDLLDHLTMTAIERAPVPGPFGSPAPSAPVAVPSTLSGGSPGDLARL